MKRFLLLFLVLTACSSGDRDVAGTNLPQSAIEIKDQTQTLSLTPLRQSVIVDNQALIKAFQQKQSNIWLEGHGEVKKLLADDNNGSRHERFLVGINQQQTLLFAHNIDLAPRLQDLQVGGQVTFRGEYVYNPKGGIIHWTHRDPQGLHQGGWIKYNGRVYE